MDNELQFRTAALGGFNKQDVINYLERSAREHGEKIQELQRSLAEAQEARTGLEQQLSTCKAALAETEERGAKLAEDLADKTELLELAQHRAGALETQLTALRLEVERLAPAAEAYAGLKDRAAGIELEAYGRAQSIEEEGRRKAQKAQKDLVAWVDGMQGVYEKLKANLETVLAGAVKELQRAGQSVEGLAGELRDPETALKSLREQAEAIAPGELEPLKVEDDLQPLPLDPPTRPQAPQGPVPFTTEGDR